MSLDTSSVPVPPDFRSGLPARLVSLAPGGWGGNHRHDAREIYVGFGEALYLVWRDGDGRKQELRMADSFHEPCAYSLPSNTPHLIENRGEMPALLYELVELDNGKLVQLTGDESLR